MESEILFYKDKIIHGNNMELIFHKDYTWIYSKVPLPVMSYTLLNCKNWSEVDFEEMDFHNDGVTVIIKQEEDKTIFETTDMGGRTTSFICDKVLVQKMEYREEDYLELLTALQSESATNQEAITKLHNREENLEKFLLKELDTSERKQRGAIWLTQERKHFIEGQQDILRKILALINRSD